MRHRGRQPIIQSVKHYVPQTDTAIASGARNVNVIADAVVAPAATNVFDVEQGSIIKAVWVEMWISLDGASGSRGTFTACLEKAPLGTFPTFTNLLNLQSYENKKNIFYTTQGIINSDIDQGTLAILRQWFLIPKGKQRFGLGDRLILSIANTSGDNMRNCGMFTYKEYS